MTFYTVHTMTQSEVKPKILYIDDALASRQLVRRLLSTPYEFFEAADGLAGIDKALEVQPDLILVDLNLPQFTGYEVAARMKSLLPNVPVVALTADMAEHVRERALASGCDGYIAKPIDAGTFVEQLAHFLAGRRETLEDDSFRDAYQQTLVARMEEQVRELTRALKSNAELNAQRDQLLKEVQRHARLLEAVARVSHAITSILNLEALLKTTVQVIGEEFGFYYVGIFLVDARGDWAVLRASHGAAGTEMVQAGYKLQVGGASLVGLSIAERRPLITLDVNGEQLPLENSPWPLTRSEMALPLIVGDKIIGAVSVQSQEETAFTEEDMTTLQTMADQLAIAIANARLLNDLESTHAELVRTKTFEAIATATGEAIHWVGNKAAPIPGSIHRVREDLARYLLMAHALLDAAPAALHEHKFAQMLTLAADSLGEYGDRYDLDVQGMREELAQQPLKRLQRTLNVESILEDLDIVEKSARSILNIKEDLIGPARQKRLEPVLLPALLRETVRSMGIQPDVVRFLLVEEVKPVMADPDQLTHVFINLIKNALEAMDRVEDKKLFIWVRTADDPNFVVTDITDNGGGIPADVIDKIWVAFYTSKADRGGTGLGLPACVKIVNQLGGKILVESVIGEGTTFSVYLPVIKD
ncbi:MAG TPA: ATP-binding protein [Anaerolineae bacterium]|nr:ATP-binding protein [Anaerolineae bacterium]HQH39012.1 ATP-binding protein [Anaerolineae bacterium]